MTVKFSVLHVERTISREAREIGKVGEQLSALRPRARQAQASGAIDDLRRVEEQRDREQLAELERAVRP